MSSSTQLTTARAYQSSTATKRDEEFVKRAGFVLMAQVAGKDKRAPAELLHHYLARAEREAHDERNFVKKAVNWAIREIGWRRRRSLSASSFSDSFSSLM
ncbi:hypothetical protein EKD04_013515 [Chloroflexales bacterium ZM16-3]|nr:hypothetical protein [Chloroflexales bacterium ZM16-3]